MPFPRLPLRRNAAALLTAALSLALLVGGGLIAGGAARAAFVDVPPTGHPGRLVLSSDPYPAEFLALSPGDPSYWQVAARLEGAVGATLSLQLRKTGELVSHPRGLEMTVDECDVPWIGLGEGPVCTGTAIPVAVATPLDDNATSSPTFQLGSRAASAPVFLLVTLAVEDSADARADASLMGLVGTVGIGLTAVAVDPAARPPRGGGVLPATGADVSLWVAVGSMAAGLLGLGAALRMRPLRGDR
ncbi:hypothetical protein DEU34_2425 [Microbacterium sp. AG1240]|uniref:hypothetical protein n=1 Tax=Microbacterium sp. AG1240 TaxID=2183992 RepID=UPI000F1985B5|nr:hypothetical protein [Microbacterium sp. AG1240]RKT33820.1 hypothetical protein DEU34_2425 [Microbacterium sp. AG1240]